MNKKVKHTTSDIQRFGLLGKAILVLTALSIVTVSFYAFLYLLLSMLPTFVAFVNDKSAGKTASNTVGAFNFIGVMPSLFKIWYSSDLTMAVQSLIIDPNVWLLSYGCAALGWLMVLFMPKLVVVIFTSRSDARIASLKKEQDKLVEEWGYDVRPL